MASENMELKIRGMICRSCVEDVTAILLHTRGVLRAKVNYWKASACIAYDPAAFSLADLDSRLREAGFETGKRRKEDVILDIFCAFSVLLLVWLLRSGFPGAVPRAEKGMRYGAIFLLGLLTSPHCLGMCGGILLGQSAAHRSPAVASLCYNGGRLLSYTVIGAVCGALGTAVVYTASVKSMVFTMLGLAVLLVGLNLWGVLPGLAALYPQQGSACSLPARMHSRLAGRPLLIGALTGLMPCGALYAMWMLAISEGDAIRGGLCLLLFGLGTGPLMFLFGALGSFFPRRWNKVLIKISAVLVSALGINLLLRGIKILH